MLMLQLNLDKFTKNPIPHTPNPNELLCTRLPLRRYNMILICLSEDAIEEKQEVYRTLTKMTTLT